MSNGDKWMPLYVADYLGDTMHLTTLQHGAYVLLLMHYWKTGPLPDDAEALAAITKVDAKTWPSVWAKLCGFFTTDGDGALHQKRMDWELRRWGEISEKRRDAGRRGAEAKHRSRPNGSGGSVTPPPQPQAQQSEVVTRHITPQPGQPPVLANATVLPDPLPVDNLANASNLPGGLPPPLPADSGNCHPFATHFANVPLPSQKNNLSCLSTQKCARERAPARSEQNPPPDGMNEWIDSLDQAAEAHKANLMSQEQRRTPSVQKRAVAKPRSIACRLSAEHLALVRKQAGIGVAA